MSTYLARFEGAIGAVRSISEHMDLIRNLVRRDVIGRYRGSVLGVMWSFFNPLLMLAVYTLVFSYVFQARWGEGTGSKSEFALILYAGLLPFNLFAECINKAPGLIVQNTSYVKKVIFPLEVLPVVALGSALFHFVVSLIVWFAFSVVVLGFPNITALALPLVLMPLLLLTLGVAWALAALGVYLRDISQFVGVVVSVFLFLSPIFYPVTALPPAVRSFMGFSPLTYAIEEVRNILIWGRWPDWAALAIWMCIGAAVAWAGLALFQSVRKGFADVI